MSRRQGSSGDSRSLIEAEIRSELRRILRKRADSIIPLVAFHQIEGRPAGRPAFIVALDRWEAEFSGDGHRLHTDLLGYPDERIEDRTLDFARAVWHLTDRIHQWTRRAHIRDNAWAYAGQSRDLLICGDLVNKKKHGGNDNRSGMDPWLDPVVNFDTSKSGAIEILYNGSLKELAMLVTNSSPIPFWMDVYADARTERMKQRPYDPDKRIGRAADIIWNGFRHWIPFIARYGLLKDDGEDDAERRALRELLLPLSPS